MTHTYIFTDNVDMREVQETLGLAAVAAASLRGDVAVGIDAAYRLNSASRTCTIDATTDIGTELNRLFFGFIVRELGRESFCMERLCGGLDNTRSAA